MFDEETEFNGDVSDWDVSSVTLGVWDPAVGRAEVGVLLPNRFTGNAQARWKSAGGVTTITYIDRLNSARTSSLLKPSTFSSPRFSSSKRSVPKLSYLTKLSSITIIEGETKLGGLVVSVATVVYIILKTKSMENTVSGPRLSTSDARNMELNAK